MNQFWTKEIVLFPNGWKYVIVAFILLILSFFFRRVFENLFWALSFFSCLGFSVGCIFAISSKWNWITWLIALCLWSLFCVLAFSTITYILIKEY